MGFFHDEVVEAPKAARKTKTTRAELSQTARGCEACSLRDNWAWINSPQMAISGNTKDPDILIVGEAPGEDEDREGAAFVGESGRMLRKAIPGRDLTRVAMQNTVRCHPRHNATPSARDAHACSLHLEEDIERYPIKAILGIGSVPLNRAWPGQLITRMHGIRFPVQMGNKVLWYYSALHPSFVLRTGGDRSAAGAILRSDIKRFFNAVDKWPDPKIYKPDPTAVIIVNTEEEAEALLARMADPLGLDIETGGVKHLDNISKPYIETHDLLTAALSDGEITLAFSIDHPEQPNAWGLRFLLKVAATRQWIAHNAAFELVWLMAMAARAGIEFTPHEFDDSMAMGRLYHERETILSLAMLTRIHLGVDFKSLSQVNLSAMRSEPLSEVLPYNGLDALGSALIGRQLHRQIHPGNYARLIGGVRSTAEMELKGLPINPERSHELKAIWHAKTLDASAAAGSIYEVKQWQLSRQLEFNIGSNDHVGEALVEFGRITLPKTAKGEGKKWSTDDQDLRAAAPDNPLVKATIDYREGQKMASTYIDPVIRAAEQNIDGWLHSSYTTMHTATGRLSSEGPNIQNFPVRRHRELRSQIVAPPGHLLVSFDYGQLEARVYACATKDRALCESIIRKEDIHVYWRDRALQEYPDYIDRLAEKTNETELDAILKGGRDIIKSDFVFASFYGSVARACAERTGMPLIIAERLLGEFWARYAGAHRWVKARRQEYNDTGNASTLTGMIRHAILWGNETINTPIQGTAAHIVLDAQNAMAAHAREMDDPYLAPRINVHDDLEFILPDEPDLLEAYIEVIGQELVKVRYDWQIVPLTVDVKIGENWSSFEKVATITGEYLR